MALRETSLFDKCKFVLFHSEKSVKTINCYVWWIFHNILSIFSSRRTEIEEIMQLFGPSNEIYKNLEFSPRSFVRPSVRSSVRSSVRPEISRNPFITFF